MSTSESPKVKELYEFGPFRVDPEKEVLLRAGEPVALTPKTFQILLVLVRHSQEVVTKDDLMKAVWPDTFVEEANLSRNIFMLRKALGESPQDHQYILTVPGRGYRLAEMVRVVPEQEVSIVAARHSTVQLEVKETKPWKWIVTAGAAVVMFASAVAAWRFFGHRSVLSEKDTIVLADFVNTTGDPVFDDTLKTALSVSLNQSPFLNVLSDDSVATTLKLMTRPPDTRLTPDVARELCQRAGGKAYVAGSIASLGSEYVLGLKVVNCQSGDTLAQEQVTASAKEKVLNALGEAASGLRAELGESLASVQKLDTPLAQATTSSLEALQAYSLGGKIGSETGDSTAAVPLYQRAVRLDPKFAKAHAALGETYYILGETGLAAENIKEAYGLRDQTSEREKFMIESFYYDFVSGDLEKARQTYELWNQTYPRDSAPPTNLGVLYSHLGQYDKNLEEFREALALEPASGAAYGNLVSVYVALNRLDEARVTAADGLSKNADSIVTRLFLYQIGFLQSDVVAMSQQVSWAENRPGAEDLLLATEADTAAYLGHLRKARELSRRAVASAGQAEHKQTAANYEGDAALREAVFGNPIEARQWATASLALSTDRDVEYGVALTLALAQDTERARKLTDDLGNRFPEDTVVRFNYLPTIHAELALNPKNLSKSPTESAAQALEALQTAGPYELGTPGTIFNFACLYPVYVRGEAYLAGHQGSQAAAEFQKILDHRGIVLNEPIGALAHLGVARAYAISGETAKAKSAYQDFLTLWKDADPDIPILKEARAEFAKLR